jgi:long-subunit acyl-CoA synthetase (AMP-forming)
MLRDTKEFRVCEIASPVRCLRQPDDCDPVSVPQLLARVVENYGDHPALAYQDASKSWQFISYSEYKAKVEQFAKIFIKLGLKRWDSVGVLAFNSVEWFVSELAAIHAGLGN